MLPLSRNLVVSVMPSEGAQTERLLLWRALYERRTLVIPIVFLVRDSCTPGIVTDALFPLHLPFLCSPPFPCLCLCSVMCCQYFKEEKRIDFNSLCSSGGRVLMELGKEPVHLWVLILNTHETQNKHYGGQTILLGNVLLMEMFLRLSSWIAELTWAWMLGIFPEIQWLQRHKVGWE